MKKLLAVLLLVSNVVWSQNIDTTTGAVQTTSNIIDPTGWNNVIYMNATQLGQVEGTGGGPVPAFNTDTNTIRFSYSLYTVSQIRAINQVLSGQGISVSGFNYSWKIYNDLENCCSTRGSLVGTVNFANTSGKILESYTYDYSSLNTGANFQTISGTETFTNPYQLSSLGYVGVAWTGKDMNFWSGYYGPRVRDTEITLNYTVKQSSPTSTTSNTTSTSTDLALAASQPALQELTTTQTSTSTTASTTSEPSTTQSTAPVATSTSTITAIAPTVQVVQPSTSVQQTTNQPSAPSLSSVLSTIKNNEKKEQAIVNAAVAGANEVAQSAVQMTEQTAMSVATISSTSSMQVMQQTSNTQQASVQSINLSQGLPLVNNSITQNSTSNSQVALLTPTEISSIAIQPVIIQALPTNTQSAMTDFRSAEAENTMFANNFLTNRANPLTEIVENNTKPNNSTTEQKDKPMNKTAQNNELAIGVNIDRIATQPTGYNSYLQLALTDASFYAPKEIYRNQRVIDNQQAVRLLNFASDAKHKEMTEQQYRR